MIGQVISLVFALLGAAAVYETDAFFCIVGRTALARVSDAALVETMGRFHEVADRRMPIFGIIGIAGALASVAFSRSVRAPVNAELTRHAREGLVPADARALQARWDGVIVLRVLLMGFAVIALTAALVQSAR